MVGYSLEELKVASFLNSSGEIFVFPQTPVLELQQRQDTLKNPGFVVVDSNQIPLGVVYRSAVQAASNSGYAGDLMVPVPLINDAQMSLSSCLAYFRDDLCPYLVLVDDKTQKALGIIERNIILDEICKLAVRLETENHDLERQLKLKDDYLGLISHDIRTPLSVIALSCDFLMSEVNRPNFSDDHWSFLERIQRNVEVASSMASEILQVLRHENDHALEFDEIEISDFLKQELADFSILAKRKNITLQMHCDQSIYVNLDVRRLQHILKNLVSNAIKFSPESSTVDVFASTVLQNGKRLLKLAVKDQGTGIKSEDIERIFESFSQLENEPQKKELGIGLGLAIVKKLTEAQGGWIEVDGGWQSGACFQLYLPGVQAPQDTPKERELKERHSALPKVLLVEDDQDILEYFAEEFSRHGYQVKTAQNGEDAFYVFLRFQPDLVLSDIKMPKVDGLELLARIRNHSPDIPFILCSGNYPGLAEDLAHSPYRADHIFEKPVIMEQVVSLVEKYLFRKTFENAS